jgi:hypothetical protein
MWDLYDMRSVRSWFIKRWYALIWEWWDDVLKDYRLFMNAAVIVVFYIITIIP